MLIFHLFPRFPSEILWFELYVDISSVSKVSLSDIVI